MQTLQMLRIKIKTLISLLFLAVVVTCLSGCGAGMGPVTVTDSMVNEAGDVISTGITETADVDVVRSTNFRKMRTNRDNIIGRTYKDQGLKIEFTTVNLGNGQTAYLPKEVTFRPELRFQDPMPAQEMENPMYKTTKDIVLGVGDFFLKGWLGWLVKEAHGDSVEAAQPKYNGPYNPQNYTNSFNPVTTTEIPYAPAP
ncbi:MAG: hypothetical protein ACOYB1_18440 [Limnohabitans sp.]